MKRVMLYSCVLIVITLLMTGCWSKKELNEFAIVVAVGIDKVEEEYEVTVQIVNPSEIASNKSNGGRTPVVLYHAKGGSVFDAIRKLSTITPRKPYLSHLGMMILGEELAEEGIAQTLDLFARDQEIRGNFLVAVSDQAPAKDILSILSPLEKIPANKMYNSLKNSSEVFATSTPTKFDDLLKDLEGKGKNTVLTTIRIMGNPEEGASNANVEKTRPAAYLHYPGMAVFKNEKMVGLLNEEESKGYSYIKDMVKSTATIIACPEEGTITTEVMDSKTKVNGKMVKGKPSIELEIHSNQNVAEVDCPINLGKEKTIAELDKISSKTLKGIVTNTLDTIQNKYEADVFGFGEAIHRADPKAWKKLEKDWENIFSELEVHVKVDVKTKGLGTIVNTITKKQKE
ncbi:Ger(x)C family spore germination protein [Sporosarcina sp. resist]|uniref:Ger(x)C family spore germination protein n=1 Tax=Sporosarcina sp. resist TaxID=2762563 RepID=UPI00164DF90B|nr:Ger(x)C family spore germination protein [Sporosarcina sp. resist]QNK89127.1 Ger(x)C family spore germination protein [Sporosarcina sp. resist]